MNPLLVDAVGAIIRWLLTFVSAALVSKGIWTQDQADRYVAAATAAAAVALITLFWSLWNKYKSRLKLTTALSAPYPQTEAQIENQIANGVTASASTPKSEVPEIKHPLM